MNQHYAKQGRFFPDSAGVEQAAEAVAGQSFADFFRDYVAGVKEIPYDEFLSFAGLRAVATTATSASAGFTTTANLGAQPEVTKVDSGSDAQRAGMMVGDRVIAMNGHPADASLDSEISGMAPGTLVRLQLENRRGKREVDFKLGLRTEVSHQLQDLATVTPEQRAHRTAWILGDDEPGRVP